MKFLRFLLLLLIHLLVLTVHQIIQLTFGRGRDTFLFFRLTFLRRRDLESSFIVSILFLSRAVRHQIRVFLRSTYIAQISWLQILFSVVIWSNELTIISGFKDYILLNIAWLLNKTLIIFQISYIYIIVIGFEINIRILNIQILLAAGFELIKNLNIMVSKVLIRGFWFTASVSNRF